MNNLFDTRGLGMIGGYRIVIVPDVQGMKRSWRERLFTWPWRPWVSWKVVPTHWPETLKDSVIKDESEGVIYARAHVAEALRSVDKRKA